MLDLCTTEDTHIGIAIRVLTSCLQVLIRWALERGCSVLPKSTNEGRIAANLAVCDWGMTEGDVAALGSLSYKVGLGGVGGCCTRARL
jgi:diketogulonate reductase-like aldo/keto reductase